MAKKTGKRVSLYVSSATMDYYNYLEGVAIEKDISVSELICECMRRAVPQMYYGFEISEYANVAIAEGNFADLYVLALSDMKDTIVVQPDVRKPVNGDECRYTDKVFKFRDALSDNEE